MKKILQLLTVAALLPAVSHSQITIEAADVEMVGVFAVQSRDTALDQTIVPGGTGSQTWDFSSLKDQDRDSLRFYEASQSPVPDVFPNANVGATLDSFAYLFFDKNEEHIQAHGSFGTLSYGPFVVTAAFRYNPPQTLVKFPLELNNAYAENIRAVIQIKGSDIGQTFDSIRYVTYTQRNVVVDAYGDLTTPIGVFETLRSKEVEISKDSFYVLSNGLWLGNPVSQNADTVTFYNWWTNQNGLGFPVVQLEISPNNSPQATWLNNFVSGTHQTDNLLEIGVSPNPTNHHLNIVLPTDVKGRMEVYDIQGRLHQFAPANSSREQLNVQQLPNGSYILVLKDLQGKLVGLKRFEVVR